MLKTNTYYYDELQNCTETVNAENSSLYFICNVKRIGKKRKTSYFPLLYIYSPPYRDKKTNYQFDVFYFFFTLEP